MSGDVPLDAARVLALFQELSDRLAETGVSAQLFVVGGAAMALAYDDGRVTRDVDALFAPAPEVRQIAEDMSVAHGLEPDWLNDAAKGFLPGNDENPHTVFESESLLVQVPSPEYLLAMKLHASRDDRDLDDAAVLFNRLGYTSVQDCIDLLTNTYPLGQLMPRHRYLAEEVAIRAGKARERQQAKPRRNIGFDDPWQRRNPGPNQGGRPRKTDVRAIAHRVYILAVVLFVLAIVLQIVAPLFVAVPSIISEYDKPLVGTLRFVFNELQNLINPTVVSVCFLIAVILHPIITSQLSDSPTDVEDSEAAQ